METKSYIAIDLKSFYASVECVERGLDPLNTNLVVADLSRTEKTICLAVTPSLKSFGVSARPRLFEVIEQVRKINDARRRANGYLKGKSTFLSDLQKNPALELDYIVATPQMAKYMSVSAKVFSIYSKYVAPEDIFVYSVDEVFMDVTHYLKTYKMSAHELAIKMIKNVLSETGITATAGIGTNLYLAKIAMDIVAKKMKPDKDGVRIAELNELSYREKLWEHTPLTDFWRIGHGIAKKLISHGMYNMGDVARMSLKDEDVLYKLFGINAELIIDHAWGIEPCTMEQIKQYVPENNSLSVGQVLKEPYTYKKGLLVAKEMADGLSLDLVEKHLTTELLVLSVCYDGESLSQNNANYEGEVEMDYYGRLVPKNAYGSIHLGKYSSSTKEIVSAISTLYKQIVNPTLLVRRFYVVACNVQNEKDAELLNQKEEQITIFSPIDEEKEEKEKTMHQKEKAVQKAVLSLKHRFGKNAVLKGMNLEEGATAKERNAEIGGHRA